MNHDGYLVCSLNIPSSGWRTAFVHKLVAMAFIPNPDNLPEVNHKDYDRANPDVENLEWISRLDNVRYSKCNMPDYHGEKNPNFGNHKLSEIYSKNKEYAKEKQGRPGAQNGRCVPVSLFYDGEFVREFECAKLCFQYLIDEGVSNTNNPESIRAQFKKLMKLNKLYKKHWMIIEEK